ncbi:MAG TPA: hypothetical protein VK464_01030 [Symbiobacteriaceae bacterium]|jgi:outer membrane murein-binding lipoprotein Lpp|nr:hypothetical protein [Symbiobacteriaceae bacterium]
MTHSKAAALAAVALTLVAVMMTGCSKDTQKDARIKELEQQVTELESQVKDSEVQMAQAKADAVKASETAATEKRQFELQLSASQVRASKLAALEVQPAAETQSGWAMVADKHTYTLKGFAQAKAVRFYAAPNQQGARDELLGAGTRTADGWSWTGVLPSGEQRLAVEVEASDGTRYWAAVAAVRSGGK